jgi:Zn-dependent protease
MDLSPYISNILTLIIAITVHEFSHAITADRLGDSLPRRQGRITLNPMMHLDPIGSIMMVLIGFGWGRAVQVNPYNLSFRGSRDLGMVLVAAAGPFSNLILAMLAAIPIRLGLFHSFDLPGIAGFTPSLYEFAQSFIAINVGLILFNMLPIAPLDGSKIAVGLLPRQWAEPIARLEPYGPMILMLLLVSGRFGFDFFGFVMRPAQQGLYHLITGL